MAVEHVALAFLATYAIHSTLLLGLAWLTTRAIAASSFALRELVWRIALFGGVATASVQVATGHHALFGYWTIGDEAVDLVRAPEPTRERAPRLAAGRTEPVPALLATPADFAATAAVQLASAELAALPQVESSAWLESGPEPERELARPLPPNPRDDLATWGAAGAIAWSAVAALVALGFAAMAVRLSRRLRGARAVVDGPLRDALDRLCARSGERLPRVRLWCAPRLDVPLSFGFLRPTICVPPRALGDLTADEQEALVAHELAHLVRRDPAWLSAAWLVESLFFFQPLNRLASRELQDVAELACDAWAAQRTGGRLALASCLERIASWMVGKRRALPATSMAGLGSRSRLTRRVERLLDDSAAPAIARAHPATRFTALAALVAAALAVPGVSLARSNAAEPSVELARVAPEIGHPPSLTFEAPIAAEPATEVEGDLALALTELERTIEALEREARDLRGEIGSIDTDGTLAPALESVERRLVKVQRRCARLARAAELLETSRRAEEELAHTGP